MNKKVVMFLMNQKGYYVLKEFINFFGVEAIHFVVSSRDNNVENDYYEDIVQLCSKFNILCFDRKDEFFVGSTYCFSIGWRWLIHDADNLIVFHDSLLPKYRGFAPLVSYLLNQESKIGVTALFADKEYDKGHIIEQQDIQIEYPIKIQEAIEKITPLYFNLVKNITIKILKGKPINAIPQNEIEASYSLWRDEEDYYINWDYSANYIKRFIDAVGYPYKGAYSYIDGQKIRILDAEVVEDVDIEQRHSGKVIFLKEGEPIVVCGKGLLKITRMIDDSTKKSLLPFKRFRVRFK